MNINISPFSRTRFLSTPLIATINLVLAAFLVIAVPFSAEAGIKQYNMDRLLFEAHPFAGQTPVTPAPATIKPIVNPKIENAGIRLYNMDRLLNERHPFATPPPGGSTEPATPASPPPAKSAKSNLDDILDKLDSEPDDFDLSEDEEDFGNDPLEPMNRVIFAFNEAFIKYLLGPVARGYNAVLPAPVRKAIRNFLENANNPVILANDLLQGEIKRGTETGLRLIINSTVGLAGFVDVAQMIGIEKHKEDFGQTLAVWGMGEGFYLVLPLFGPSNPRDAFGKFLVDPNFDPLRYVFDNKDDEELLLAVAAFKGITTYANVVKELDDFRESSIDFYGAMRSLYRQRRQLEIRNGRPLEKASLEY